MSTLLATGWDAVNRYRKIEEATAPKDDPAPGWCSSFSCCDRLGIVWVGGQPNATTQPLPAVYLLDEIADLSKQSPEAATAIAEAVQKKLAAKHPVVKFKVGVLSWPFVAASLASCTASDVHLCVCLWDA